MGVGHFFPLKWVGGSDQVGGWFRSSGWVVQIKSLTEKVLVLQGVSGIFPQPQVFISFYKTHKKGCVELHHQPNKGKKRASYEREGEK
jgi:hypothetical protein